MPVSASCSSRNRASRLSAVVRATQAAIRRPAGRTTPAKSSSPAMSCTASDPAASSGSRRRAASAAARLRSAIRSSCGRMRLSNSSLQRRGDLAPAGTSAASDRRRHRADRPLPRRQVRRQRQPRVLERHQPVDRPGEPGRRRPGPRRPRASPPAGRAPPPPPAPPPPRRSPPSPAPRSRPAAPPPARSRHARPAPPPARRPSTSPAARANTRSGAARGGACGFAGHGRARYPRPPQQSLSQAAACPTHSTRTLAAILQIMHLLVHGMCMGCISQKPGDFELLRPPHSPLKSNSAGSSRWLGLAWVSARNRICRRPGLFSPTRRASA